MNKICDETDIFEKPWQFGQKMLIKNRQKYLKFAENNKEVQFLGDEENNFICLRYAVVIDNTGTENENLHYGRQTLLRG